jgi:hypothetical protein
MKFIVGTFCAPSTLGSVLSLIRTESFTFLRCPFLSATDKNSIRSSSKVHPTSDESRCARRPSADAHTRRRTLSTHLSSIGEIGDWKPPRDEQLWKSFILRFAESPQKYASPVPMSTASQTRNVFLVPQTQGRANTHKTPVTPGSDR